MIAIFVYSNKSTDSYILLADCVRSSFVLSIHLQYRQVKDSVTDQDNNDRREN